MAQQTSEPLDEIVWRSPGLYHQFFGGTLTPMTALLYFRESPFFDRLSNNASLWTQAQYNPSLSMLLHSREALESRLKSMTGLEFSIALSSPETNFFAIRRQIRKGRRLPKYDLGERADGQDGKIEDVRVEGVFFVVGENIYPAPRVGQVLASRQLAVVTHLRNALRRAGELVGFTPSMGHYYGPPGGGVALAGVGGGGGASHGSVTGGVVAGEKSQANTQPPSQIATPSQTGITATSSMSLASHHTQPPQSQPHESSSSATQQSSSTSKSTQQPQSQSSQSFLSIGDLAELRAMQSSIFISLKHSNEYMDSPPPPPPSLPPSQTTGTAGTSFTTAAGSTLPSQGTATATSIPTITTSTNNITTSLSSSSSQPGGKKDIDLLGKPSSLSINSSQVGITAGGGSGVGGQVGQGRTGDGVPKIKRRKSKAAGSISPT